MRIWPDCWSSKLSNATAVYLRQVPAWQEDQGFAMAATVILFAIILLQHSLQSKFLRKAEGKEDEKVFNVFSITLLIFIVITVFPFIL